MEYTVSEARTYGKIKCCDCDILIDPNPTNMCAECLRKRVDITESIPKQVIIYCCKGCERYLKPPDQWLPCALESRELLAFCLKRLTSLKHLNLVDATFIWTEPHSKRIKVKLVVQKEAFGVILQQELVVEYVVNTHMCTDCHRTEACSFWRAVVQLRQKVRHKKTFFYLEQLILKHSMHSSCVNIKPSGEGLDFFFAKKDDARKMVDFFMSVVPCRYSTAQELVSHDTHSNTYDYKWTFSVEMVPICKDDVVCLSPSMAASFGNIGRICVCIRVTTSIYLIDPATLQTADITTLHYWRSPFKAIGHWKDCTEYTVMDSSFITDSERIRFRGQGPLSHKHVLSDVWVVRSNEVGTTDNLIHTRSHLGHLLHPGDSVMGLDLATINVNDTNFNKLKKDELPDTILVKKVFADRATRRRKRKWKLKHLDIEDASQGGSTVERDFDQFLEDLEEDPEFRKGVNIYKDPAKIAVDTDDEDAEYNKITLQEMLDDLTLEGDNDVDGEGGSAMVE